MEAPVFQGATPVDPETVRFHQVVEKGSLEELRLALESGAVVDAPGHTGKTALMLAIAAQDLDKVKLLIASGADPELTDDFNDTPLLWAVGADFVEGVRYLLSLDVDRGHCPKHPLKKVDYSLFSELEIPDALKGVLSEDEWKNSMRSLNESGQNPQAEPIIRKVQSVAVLKLFLEAGDDLNLAPNDVKRELVGLENEGTLGVTAREYRAEKSPRFGTGNPQRMDCAFWRDMVRTGVNAYVARTTFKDEKSLNKPVWCYDRYGSTITPLKDGRFVQIGGEHEDFYDPDFYIYNDVVVHDGKGGFEIYGYPEKVFPPTDFHAAVLCPDGIYIIGCLGYVRQRRQGFTPVYRLSLDDWKIEAVETQGEMPGWISEHRAVYDEKRNTIRLSGGQLHVIGRDGKADLVTNERAFDLDLGDVRWRKIQ